MLRKTGASMHLCEQNAYAHQFSHEGSCLVRTGRSFMVPPMLSLPTLPLAKARTLTVTSLSQSPRPAAALFMQYSSEAPARRAPRTPPPAPLSSPARAQKPATSAGSWHAKADAFLSTLNPEQMRAATTQHHAVRVKAGPGSGKTRVVAARVAWLLKSRVPPQELLVITFTNKAAGELKERIAGILGPSVARDITAGTFHSISARILRRNVELLKCGLTDEFTIYDTDDTAAMTKRLLEDHNDYGGLSNATRGKLTVALCGAFSKVKNMMPTTFGANIPGAFEVALERREIAFPILEGVDMRRLRHPFQLAHLFEAYNSKLRSNNAVDFDDLLGLTVALLKRKDVQSFYNNKFKCVLVDEFQDTNEPQYALSRLLKGDRGSLFVVGDPDQAVYSWRGANPSIFLDSFAKQYRDAATFFLNTNHRSGANILRCAEAVLAHDGLPSMHETLRAVRTRGPGTVQHITLTNEFNEALEVAKQIKWLVAKQQADFKDVAVLYRTKLQAQLLRMELTRSGIPYVVLGDRSLWERAEIKDAMAFLRIVNSPLTDSIALERVINKPARGIGDAMIKKLKAAAAAEGVGLPELLFKDCWQVWLPREAVEAKLQEIKLAAEQCKKEFYQGKKDSKGDKAKVLTQDKAKEIIQKMKAPLISMQAAPDLDNLPLPPALKKGPGVQGLCQLRNLVVLARSAARYRTLLGDVITVCMEATGYIMDLMNEGGSKSELDILTTMANHEEVWLTAVDANLSQLEAPNNLAAQYLAGAMPHTAVVEAVDVSSDSDSDSNLEAWSQQGPDTGRAPGRAPGSHSGSSSTTMLEGARSAVEEGGGSSSDWETPAWPEALLCSGTGDEPDDPKLSKLRKFLEHTALISDLEDRKDDESLNRVRLMTLHTSKGLEFNTVFVAGFEEGLCPYERGGDDDGSKLPTNFEEEKRLAYVGATRAKERLFFLSAQTRRRQDRQESRYTPMLRALGPGVLNFRTAAGAGTYPQGSPSWGSGQRSPVGGQTQPERQPHGAAVGSSSIGSSRRSSGGSRRSSSSRGGGGASSASGKPGNKTVKPANGW